MLIDNRCDTSSVQDGVAILRSTCHDNKRSKMLPVWDAVAIPRRTVAFPCMLPDQEFVTGAPVQEALTRVARSACCWRLRGTAAFPCTGCGAGSTRARERQ